MRAEALVRISGVVDSSCHFAQGRTAASSSVDTTAKTMACARKDAPRAAAIAPPTAPPANMRKVRSTVRVSITPRTRAAPIHHSHAMRASFRSRARTASGRVRAYRLPRATCAPLKTGPRPRAV